jgi:hypothetical protein
LRSPAEAAKKSLLTSKALALQLAGLFRGSFTAFSILVFTESMQQSGFFLKKKPPSMHS